MTTTTEPTAAETPEQYMRREVALFRERIGIDFAEPLFSVRAELVTFDGIRRYAYGLGDDNPLYCDRQHAAGSRWGGVVAPPGFFSACGKVRTEYAPTAEEAGRGRDALVNHNLMHSGGRIRWFGPVLEGDRIRMRTFYLDCVLKGSEANGWVAVSTFRQVFWNQIDDVVCIWDVDAVHPYDQPKVDYQPPARSVAFLEVIDEAYEAEVPRGPLPRYVEDLAIGEALPPITKGPLVTSDVVAWAQGAPRHDVAPNRLSYKKRRAGEALYAQNHAGGWDSYMSVHWDPSVSSQFGMKQPFDWGMMRTGYMLHALSDWVGDDGIVVEVRDRIRAINVVGNVSTITGEVVAIDEPDPSAPDSWPEVHVEIRCTNQDGVMSASSAARVRLPSKRLGLPRHPLAPTDHGLLPAMKGFPGSTVSK